MFSASGRQSSLSETDSGDMLSDGTETLPEVEHTFDPQQTFFLLGDSPV
jgi:hypothetical protein